MKRNSRIIAFPHKHGSGGPGSFQYRFEKLLSERGWCVRYADYSKLPDIVFIVGGTRRILWLILLRLRGIPIVYRLDGINWIHRMKKTSWRNYLLCEIRRISGKFLHAFVVDKVVYQSEFVKTWWEKSGWRIRDSSTIIYNGVDCNEFRPNTYDINNLSLICVEGNIDYSPYAIELLNQLAKQLEGVIPIKLYGGFENKFSQTKLSSGIQYFGKVERNKVPGILQSGIYLSVDVNPACPNTVIEAMACGIPVVGFNTGALSEIVIDGSGELAQYGSDPWELGTPDINALVNSILKVLSDWESYSTNARQVALKRFNIEKMYKSYENVLESMI